MTENWWQVIAISIAQVTLFFPSPSTSRTLLAQYTFSIKNKKKKKKKKMHAITVV